MMMTAPQWIDSHCHLDRIDLNAFDSFAHMLETARTRHVVRFLCVSVTLEAWQAMADLAAPFADIDLSVGVHPSELGTKQPDAALLQHYAEQPKVVAIGETGLDYHYAPETKDLQHDSFALHIALARTLNKPLIIHTRSAKADTIAQLRAGGAEAVGGVLHCFTEDWAMAKAGLDMGFYVSFSGIATFKNAQDLRDVT